MSADFTNFTNFHRPRELNSNVSKEDIQLELRIRATQVKEFLETWNKSLRSRPQRIGQEAQSSETVGIEWVGTQEQRGNQLLSGNLAFELKAFDSCSTGCSGSDRTASSYTAAFNQVAQRTESPHHPFPNGHGGTWVNWIVVSTPELSPEELAAASKASCFAEIGQRSERAALPGLTG